MLTLVDVFGKKHTFKFRYWINNASRMYLIEGTHELQHRFKMGVGDALMFAKGESETIHVCGRKGSPEDFARKPPLKRKSEGGESKAKRAASAAPSGADGSGGRTPAGGGQLKSKRTQQKHPRQPREEVPEVQNAYTYWAGLSLPAKVDGVFRAMPNAAPRDSSGVEAQFGFWSAIVTLGGERFQAFFNSQEHAMAAYDAALQTADGA